MATGLPGATVDEPLQLATALDWLERGKDFADALHLARSAHGREFIIFNQKFAKRAKDLACL